ncbi:cache domain-containing protein [Bradyrhizobium sp. WU425]|uniref:cache domain-containing protein n=1 Tax=Bradyrhizobium sp. WU425 TaxID=187029 RepID=UPI001E3867A0|nr:cache domain-containing protein [Bradyrhizobium canariense]UFW74692.1 cache domain-containing protein [Bradyrhizobium canariense]
MLGNLRIHSKLLLMLGLSVGGIFAVAGVGLSALRSNLIEDRKTEVRELVRLARQVIDLHYQAAIKDGLSEAETLARSKALLRTIRFGREDYLYALDPDGTVQVSPVAGVESQSLMNVKDVDGVFFARRQIQLAVSRAKFHPFSGAGN